MNLLHNICGNCLVVAALLKMRMKPNIMSPASHRRIKSSIYTLNNTDRYRMSPCFTSLATCNKEDIILLHLTFICCCEYLTVANLIANKGTSLVICIIIIILFYYRQQSITIQYKTI